MKNSIETGWQGGLRFRAIPTDAFSYARTAKNGRLKTTSCPNCGAPYTGKETCEYCGTAFQIPQTDYEYVIGSD